MDELMKPGTDVDVKLDSGCLAGVITDVDPESHSAAYYCVGYDPETDDCFSDWFSRGAVATRGTHTGKPAAVVAESKPEPVVGVTPPTLTMNDVRKRFKTEKHADHFVLADYGNPVGLVWLVDTVFSDELSVTRCRQGVIAGFALGYHAATGQRIPEGGDA